MNPEGRRFWSDISPLALDHEARGIIARVESAREHLRSDRSRIQRVDFGTGSQRRILQTANTVCIRDLVDKASVTRRWGLLLFKVARRAGSTAILELGSCVGISSAYLLAALELNGGGTFVTIEGDPNLCRIVRETVRSVSKEPAEVVEGRFLDVLPSVLAEHGTFDLVFIDGHHNPTAVQTYLEMISPNLRPGAVVILDDIQPLTGAVRPAWKSIVRQMPIAWKFDLMRMGILRTRHTQ